ncbi:MAG: 16S rRNA (uracil(1498)-N(3))-methyltransferase [Candidatus Dormibacteraeota bacterium]|nr:16S rRNA (uracil(1498)-N(3))-methyltransferase [Candidatus Dormibacteraeota bacterium]
MPRFFVDAGAVRDGVVVLEGEDAAHLTRSLRVRAGERLVVVEDGRWMHEILVTEALPARVTGAVQRTDPASGEPGVAIHVLQAIPARGMDDAIEAVAIAGARAIHPVVTERGVARPGAPAAERRTVRWQAIAREAAQLAGRARVPVVAAPRSLDGALAALPAGCRILACAATADATPITEVDLDRDHPVALVIGPEGGLGPGDLSTLHAARGWERVHLGERIVPSRLAGFMAVSLLLGARGELDRAPSELRANTASVSS